MRDKAIGGVLAVCGTLGTLAGVMLTVRGKGGAAACDINPLISCGSVMDSPQSQAFGFPNPIIALGTFPAVAVLGVLLLAGVRLPRPVWWALNAGAAAGVLFTHWLIYQSLYVIGALCPYCMLTWIVTITIFWYVTARNVRQGRFGWMLRYHSTCLLVWLLVIAGLIGQAFWDQWMIVLVT